MIAVSLKLVRKEGEGHRAPITSRPGRHLNSLRIAPPDRPPPAGNGGDGEGSARGGGSGGLPPSPRPLHRPTSPVAALLSSPQRRTGSARRAPPGRAARSTRPSPRDSLSLSAPAHTRSPPAPAPPTHPAAIASLPHRGTGRPPHHHVCPPPITPPPSSARRSRPPPPVLEPREARPPREVTAAAAARAPASPRTSRRRPPRPHSPARRAAGRPPALIQPSGSHLAGAAAARAPLRGRGAWGRCGPAATNGSVSAG
ncbi:uncharacterized protein LOC133626780 [Colius striatus]|uniref:uncharacterized protein LOC133626780 n=1 Tax=Colius striatus TaxID=57412 RepID=UPI002B1D3F13|nr:uncharacterized protein LOC133626780 [Colius striatus]